MGSACGVRPPLYFSFTKPFGIAALWERWKKYGHDVQSCCVVTTDANPLVRQVHERMPVLLDEQALTRWLELTTPMDEVRKLLSPTPAEWLRPFVVDQAVNNPQ